MTKTAVLKPLSVKYEKFWSEDDSNLNNARKVLTNFCVRKYLAWAPSMFQQLGKKRESIHVTIVKSILDNPRIVSVASLLDAVNNEIKVYPEESSLLQRLQYICLKTNIGYSLDKCNDFLSLKIESSQNVTSVISPNKGESLIPLQQLWKSYKHFQIDEAFTNPQILALEDSVYKEVTLLNDPNKLEKGEDYLYIALSDGSVWFAPSFVNHQKLTHGGLFRKACLISENGKNLSVIAAGTTLKTIVSDHEVTNEKAMFLTLGSGHFLPEWTAYIPSVEILMDKLEDYSIYIQGHPSVGNSHYKNLDVNQCNKVTLKGIKETKNLKLELLQFIQDCSGNLTLVDSKNLVDIANKMLLSVNMGSAEFDPGVSFTDEELEKIFTNEILSPLVETYIEMLPESIQQPRNSGTMNQI